jgi:hypothetical protein
MFGKASLTVFMNDFNIDASGRAMAAAYSLNCNVITGIPTLNPSAVCQTSPQMK